MWLCSFVRGPNERLFGEPALAHLLDPQRDGGSHRPLVVGEARHVRFADFQKLSGTTLRAGPFDEVADSVHIAILTLKVTLVNRAMARRTMWVRRS